MKTVLSLFCLLAGIGFAAGAVNRRRARNLRKSGLYPPPGGGTEGNVKPLLALVGKTDAIRRYREIHDVDLKSAKEAVGHLEQEPNGFV